jgi:hypothetical protein
MIGIDPREEPRRGKTKEMRAYDYSRSHFGSLEIKRASLLKP